MAAKTEDELTAIARQVAKIRLDSQAAQDKAIAALKTDLTQPEMTAVDQLSNGYQTMMSRK